MLSLVLIRRACYYPLSLQFVLASALSIDQSVSLVSVDRNAARTGEKFRT